ncbi:hypothetical protein FGB62_112g024 [Gracilaria domingensis]|nr:hypothetical protein FGB62_112g024 [Gracilaria domingensis]
MTLAELKAACKAGKLTGYFTKNKPWLVQALANWKESTESQMTFADRIGRLALESWCFKPRKQTEDMRAGSRNEAMLQRALPDYLLQHANLLTLSARKYGLLQRRESAFSHIATSPDLVIVAMRNRTSNNIEPPAINQSPGDAAVPIVWEFKTFSANSFLRTAYDVRDKWGPYTELNIVLNLAHETPFNTGTDSESQWEKSKSQLHSLVPWKAYRYQILHHIAVCQTTVLFVAASRFEIIYAVRVSVLQCLADSVSTITRHLEQTFLPWSVIPVGTVSQYPSHVFGFGKDYHSVTSCLQFIYAYHEKVQSNGPSFAAKYVRPSLIAHWNIHKGGTDVMSGVVSNCPFHMSKLSSRGIIIRRFVQIMFVNAYYIRRVLSTDENNFKSYRL